MNGRIRLVSLFLGIGVLIVISRLFFWQFIKGGEFSSLAQSQYLRGEELKAKRGPIYTWDGQPIVLSSLAWTVWAEPPKFNKDLGEIADLLAKVLAWDRLEVATESAEIENLIDEEEDRIYRLISRENARWVLLREKINELQKQEIERLGIQGIGFSQGEVRMYPEGSMAASILGFVGKNKSGGDQGYFGLEGFYDLTLSGKPGYKREERDARGNPIPFGLFSELLPVHGLSLITFIDRTVQYTIEQALAGGIEKYGAKSGSVIVMRPTGEIIGMASSPTYDPVRYKTADSSLFRNPAVADSFEPGSIFKPLVMASALDAGVVDLDTKCDICEGPVKIDKYLIKTWNGKYYKDATMTDVIVRSNNIGMVFVTRRLGSDRLWDYLDKFGLGKLTGVDLQEEANPALRERGSWNDVDLATASFGQGVAVTPIQFIRAFSALANKGFLPQPRLVAKLKGDGWEQEIKPKKEESVVSQEIITKITEMLVAAVEEGEAKWAKPVGFRIAGKTGTAQIPIAGHYDTDKTITSFVGFAPAPPSSGAGPADNPKFVMLVTLREPTSSPWGSETAAPLWFSIARDLFPYFGIQPSQ